MNMATMTMGQEESRILYDKVKTLNDTAKQASRQTVRNGKAPDRGQSQNQQSQPPYHPQWQQQYNAQQQPYYPSTQQQYQQWNVPQQPYYPPQGQQWPPMPAPQRATPPIAVTPIIDPNGPRERPILVEDIDGVGNFSPELSAFMKVFKGNKPSRFSGLNLDTDSVDDWIDDKNYWFGEYSLLTGRPIPDLWKVAVATGSLDGDARTLWGNMIEEASKNFDAPQVPKTWNEFVAIFRQLFADVNLAERRAIAYDQIWQTKDFNSFYLALNHAAQRLIPRKSDAEILNDLRSRMRQDITNKLLSTGNYEWRTMALVPFKSLVERIDRVLDMEAKTEKKKRPYSANMPATILEKLSRRHDSSTSKTSDSKPRSNFFRRKSRTRMNAIGTEDDEASGSDNESPEGESTEKDHYAELLFALSSGPRPKKSDPTWNLWCKQNQACFTCGSKGHKISACPQKVKDKETEKEDRR